MSWWKKLLVISGIGILFLWFLNKKKGQAEKTGASTLVDAPTRLGNVARSLVSAIQKPFQGGLDKLRSKLTLGKIVSGTDRLNKYSVNSAKEILATANPIAMLRRAAESVKLTFSGRTATVADKSFTTVLKTGLNEARKEVEALRVKTGKDLSGVTGSLTKISTGAISTHYDRGVQNITAKASGISKAGTVISSKVSGFVTRLKAIRK